MLLVVSLGRTKWGKCCCLLAQIPLNVQIWKSIPCRWATEATVVPQIQVSLGKRNRTSEAVLSVDPRNIARHIIATGQISDYEQMFSGLEVLGVFVGYSWTEKWDLLVSRLSLSRLNFTFFTMLRVRSAISEWNSVNLLTPAYFIAWWVRDSWEGVVTSGMVMYRSLETTNSGYTQRFYRLWCISKFYFLILWRLKELQGT